MIPARHRVWIDRAVNLALLWSGSLLAGSGLVLEYRVGYEAPRGTRVWGMDGHAWASLHWTLGLVVVAGLGLHLFRHRRWLWTVLVSRLRPALILVLLVALALLLAPLLTTPDNPRTSSVAAPVPTALP